MNSKNCANNITEFDGAGIIYPYVADKNWNSVYRIEAVLKRTPDPDAVRKAAAALREKYPYFFGTVVKVGSCLALAPSKKCETVFRSTGVYCKPFDLQNGLPLIRFIYSSNKISLEMFHCLTDGHGGVEFMKEFLREYAKFAGAADGAESTYTPDKCDLTNTTDTFSDIYDRVYMPNVKKTGRFMSDAHQFDKTEQTPLTVDTINIPFERLHTVSHRLGVTVAMLLAAIQIKAIFASESIVGRKVRLSVPVDIRRFFGSTSCRNSSLYILVEADRHDAMDFKGLLEYVKYQFTDRISTEKLYAMARANVEQARMKAFTSLPLPLKKGLLKFGYSHLGENQFTATLTDIGPINLDFPGCDIVKDIYFILGKQKTKPVNTAVTTFNGTLKLVVSHTTECHAFLDALRRIIDAEIYGIKEQKSAGKKLHLLSAAD